MGHGDERWAGAIDEAILNFLTDHGHADLDGLLHVLQRTGISIGIDELKSSVARLADRGKVRVGLEGEARSPTVRLVAKPFYGTT